MYKLNLTKNIKNYDGTCYYVSDMVVLMTDKKFLEEFNDNNKNIFMERLQVMKNIFTNSKVILMKNYDKLFKNDEIFEHVINNMFNYENTIFAWLRRFIHWYFQINISKSYNDEQRAIMLYIIMARIYYLINNCEKYYDAPLSEDYNYIKLKCKILNDIFFTKDHGKKTCIMCDYTSDDKLIKIKSNKNIENNNIGNTKSLKDSVKLYYNYLYNLEKKQHDTINNNTINNNTINNDKEYDSFMTKNKKNDFGILYKVRGYTFTTLCAILKALYYESIFADSNNGNTISHYYSSLIEKSMFYNINYTNKDDQQYNFLKNSEQHATKFQDFDNVIIELQYNKINFKNNITNSITKYHISPNDKFLQEEYNNNIHTKSHLSNTTCVLKYNITMGNDFTDHNFYTFSISMYIINIYYLYASTTKSLDNTFINSNIFKYIMSSLPELFSNFNTFQKELQNLSHITTHNITHNITHNPEQLSKNIVDNNITDTIKNMFKGWQFEHKMNNTNINNKKDYICNKYLNIIHHTVHNYTLLNNTLLDDNNSVQIDDIILNNIMSIQNIIEELFGFTVNNNITFDTLHYSVEYIAMINKCTFLQKTLSVLYSRQTTDEKICNIQESMHMHFTSSSHNITTNTYTISEYTIKINMTPKIIKNIYNNKLLLQDCIIGNTYYDMCSEFIKNVDDAKQISFNINGHNITYELTCLCISCSTNGYNYDIDETMHSFVVTYEDGKKYVHNYDVYEYDTIYIYENNEGIHKPNKIYEKYLCSLSHRKKITNSYHLVYSPTHNK